MNNPKWKEFFSDDMRLDNFETLEEIFETDAWKSLINTLKHDSTNAPTKCKKMCSVPLDVDTEGTRSKMEFGK